MLKNTILTGIMGLLLIGKLSAANAGVPADSISELKSEIVAMALDYQGLGDPDQSKQKTIEPLVERLIQLNPMPPVKDRLQVLAGAWKQVWGPYDYRDDNGGVDPSLGLKEIYQVVFADGYYYNVAPYYPKGDKTKEKIGFLRGEFKLDSNDENGLRVRFTKYPGLEHRPVGIQLWDLPALSESKQLEDEISIVPCWIVRLFFGGGKLEEVYTDQDLRIVYGTKNAAGSRRSIYIMTRVN